MYKDIAFAVAVALVLVLGVAALVAFNLVVGLFAGVCLMAYGLYCAFRGG